LYICYVTKQIFLVIIILLIGVIGSVLAQNNTKNKHQDNAKRGVLKYYEFSIGGALNSDGWGIFIERVRIPSDLMKRVIQINIFETRHPKQYITTVNNSQIFGNNKSSFVFGKINKLYTINLLLGWRHRLGRKAEYNGVDIFFTYLIGPSLGLAKPYYLELQYGLYDIRSEKYTEENKDVFLDIYAINGKSGFAKGIDEIKPYPGGTAKAGLQFDWASYDEIVKAIEVGAAIDVYYKNVPLMIIAKNNFIYPKVYLTLQLGNRW